MIRVAIIDDNQEMLDLIYKIAADELEKNRRHAVEIRSFIKPAKLKYILGEKQHFDLYLVDVEMPEINGIELARHIRKMQEDAYIVFLTSHPQFAIHSYDLSIQAYQYILKSNMKKLLPQVLERIAQNLANQTDQFLFIKNQVRFEKIKHQKIIRIYKEDKNAIIVAENGIHKKRATLESLMKELKESSFIQIERGNIVNIEHIDKIQRTEVHMDNGDILEISRANVKWVKRRVNQYWGANL